MPRYEFYCDKCEQRQAVRYPMGQVPPVVSCEHCPGPAYRIFSAPQVNVSSLHSDANRQGLAEINATAKTDEKFYNKRWDRRMQSL